MSYTINSIPLNETSATYGTTTISSFRSELMAQTKEWPLPSFDSTYTIVLDLFGVKRIITISGNCVSNDTTKIDAFITAMEALISGAQFNEATGGYSFTHDIPAGSNINVVVKGFRYDYVMGVPNRIEYNMTLLEGNA